MHLRLMGLIVALMASAPAWATSCCEMLLGGGIGSRRVTVVERECRGFVQGEPVFLTPETALSPGTLDVAQPLTDDEWEAALAKLQKPLREAIKADRGMTLVLKERLGKAKILRDPEALLNSLAADGKLSDSAIRKMAGFVYLAFSKVDAELLGQKLARWIQNADDALYLYQHLEDFENADVIFERLREQNVYFQSAYTVPGVPRTFQTFAFEKETPEENELIAMLWRHKNFSDEEWFNLDPRRRLDVLHDNFRSAVPTSLGSAALGKLDVETLGGWEIKHRSFEFVLERLKTIVFELARQLKETHSFHIHQVFDLELGSIHNQQFKVWHKLKADELVIVGLEKGLHPTRITGVTRIPDYSNAVSPVKFWTLAIRGWDLNLMKSKARGFAKISLEYRDAIRNLPDLFARIERNAAEIQAGIWMKPEFPSSRFFDAYAFAIPTFETHDDVRRFTLKLKSLGIGERIVNRLRQTAYRDIDRNEGVDARTPISGLAIALMDYKSAIFYDSATNTYYRPSPQQQQRIAQARQQLLNSLKSIEQEIVAGEAGGNYHEDEDIFDAIKMSVSEFARAARISEIYQRRIDNPRVTVILD